MSIASALTASATEKSRSSTEISRDKHRGSNVLTSDGQRIDIYGPRGERKGWGRQRDDGGFDIYDTRGRRLLDVRPKR
jgi:hypothetical protein